MKYGERYYKPPKQIWCINNKCMWLLFVYNFNNKTHEMNLKQLNFTALATLDNWPKRCPLQGYKLLDGQVELGCNDRRLRGSPATDPVLCVPGLQAGPAAVQSLSRRGGEAVSCQEVVARWKEHRPWQRTSHFAVPVPVHLQQQRKPNYSEIKNSLFQYIEISTV